MSIYLSIASIEDKEVINTVQWALQNAETPAEIKIGVAITSGDQFFDKVKKEINKKNVFIKQFDPINDRGIGNGRNNAKFAYDDEDYIIQVDSHTYFKKNWDSFSKKLFEKALEETGNEKTVVTGYLPPYIHSKNNIEILSGWLAYSIYMQENINNNIPLKKWFTSSIGEFPDNKIKNKNKIFYPANKIGADYLVANKNWAQNSGLPKELVFWEEEVIQSINLLNMGFSLVFPNLLVPLAHRYFGHEVIDRQVSDELYENEQIIENKIIENIKNFVKNNEDACKKYEKYCSYNLITNSLGDKIIPESY